MEINQSNTVAEVTTAFTRYEHALCNNDLVTLEELFWVSPHTIRYGATESLYGIEAIRAFRAARSPAGLARTLQHTVITTFGDNMATVNTEFIRPSSTKIGRQSQTWVKMREGWRVVAAHISLIDVPPPNQ